MRLRFVLGYAIVDKREVFTLPSSKQWDARSNTYVTRHRIDDEVSLLRILLTLAYEVM